VRQAGVSPQKLLAKCPPPWPEPLLPRIQGQLADSRRKLVVLDDDPTGSQTVHGLAVLTHWSVNALAAELTTDRPAFFILTNTRSRPSQAAGAINREIGRNLVSAARRTGVEMVVASRGDSTLRGHYPAETDPLGDALGTGPLPCLLVPFFGEGGRYTVNDVHYVAKGDRWVPAARTAYANDAAFGYRHSNLKNWVAEKTGGRVGRDQVVSLTLDGIRSGGPDHVRTVLAGLPPGAVCVVNAAAYSDLEVVVAGLLAAEAEGCRFLYRTAASFVRVRAGIAPRRGFLAADAITTAGTAGGLTIVGSYVARTTAQVAALKRRTDVVHVAARVDRLLDPAARSGEMARLAQAVADGLSDGRDVVVCTSRRLVGGVDAEGSLEIGRRVSDCLVALVRGIERQPRFLVAKGGITASDVATRGLGVRRAEVIGQALPGVPVWRLGPETPYPGLAYVVFPGNVGDDDALVSLHRRLKRRPPPPGTAIRGR
jgi:uncharacterized protein YgbK (DUF1537 family)